MNRENETPEERFKRLAEKRTNEVFKRLKILGNCSNRQIYSYTSEEVDRIFSAIEKKVKEVRAKFDYTKARFFKL